MMMRYWQWPRRRARAAGDRGMTLIEIMIVLVLIALVASAVGVMVIHRFREGQLKATEIRVRNISGSVQQYLVSHGDCPSLEELIAKRYLDGEPRDPWGSPILIRCPGQHDPDGADILSPGPDRKEGTDDDVRSWKR